MIQRHLLALEAEGFLLHFVRVLAEVLGELHMNGEIGGLHTQRAPGMSGRFQFALQLHCTVVDGVGALQRHRIEGNGFAVHLLRRENDLRFKGEGLGGLQKSF